jgi:hypothetical protein
MWALSRPPNDFDIAWYFEGDDEETYTQPLTW